jgi:hypothetical protein
VQYYQFSQILRDVQHYLFKQIPPDVQYYRFSQVHMWCTAPLQYLLFGQPTWCTALPILSVYLMYSILLYTHSVIPPYVQHYLQSAHLIIKITISLPTVYLLLPNWQHSSAMKREKMGNVDKISSINTQGIFPLLFWRHSGSSFLSRFCRKIRTFGRFGIPWNKGKSTVCNTRISHHLFDHFWCIKGTVSQELHQSKIAVACGILYTGIRLAVRLSLLFANIRHHYFFVYMYSTVLTVFHGIRSMSSFFCGITETILRIFFSERNYVANPTYRPARLHSWRNRFTGIDS